jgi:hypothetical protein
VAVLGKSAARFCFESVTSVLLFVLVAALPSAAQSSARTVPHNLAQLTSKADVIVRGQVLSVHVEPHPKLRNLQTVLVTLRVSKCLKGYLGKTFTFRQYLWDERARYSSARTGYRRGRELLLFMNAPSRVGLSSPVGLEQGRFRILRGSSGAKVAINGAGNAGLFGNVRLTSKALSASAAHTINEHRSGAVPLEDLEEIIARLVSR